MARVRANRPASARRTERWRIMSSFSSPMITLWCATRSLLLLAKYSSARISLWRQRWLRSMWNLERQPEIDVLLLDLDMPGVNGTIGLTLLRSKYPAVPIIVVSAARDPAIVRRAVSAARRRTSANRPLWRRFRGSYAPCSLAKSTARLIKAP